MLPTSTEKFLNSSDGTVIFARAVGQRDKPSLVFIHGLALSGIVFDDLFKEESLLNRFYLISYDMRGHGRSGKPETLDGHVSRLYADDFATVARAFDLNKPLLIGWSLGATVACDVCTHLEPGFISGAVYLSGLPYVGPIMQSVCTPLIQGYIPGLRSTDDVMLSTNTKISFIDSIFNEPETVPVSLKWTWLGTTILQSPIVATAVLSRSQDPEKLFEAGSKGLPFLLLYGTRDSHLRGDVIVASMTEHFKNMEVHMIQGGSHTPFYDDKAEFIEALIAFISAKTMMLVRQ